MNSPHLSETLGNMHDQAADLANEAGEFAHDNLVRPARDLMRQSRRRFGEMVDTVKDRLSNSAEEAEEIFYDRRDRAANWISSNPFTALAAAAGAGALLTLLIRKRC